MRKQTVLWLCAGITAAHAANFPDPTRPDTFVGAVPSSQQHVLSAIITNHSRRLAMIDGRLLKEGETIGDSRVISIGDNEVQLSTPAGKVSLSIQSTDVKESAEKPTVANRQGRGHE